MEYQVVSEVEEESLTNYSRFFLFLFLRIEARRSVVWIEMKALGLYFLSVESAFFRLYLTEFLRRNSTMIQYHVVCIMVKLPTKFLIIYHLVPVKHFNLDDLGSNLALPVTSLQESTFSLWAKALGESEAVYFFSKSF